jgi:hypothetical protein
MKAYIFLIMTSLMMVAVSTIISSQKHEIFAENKTKELCSEYDGE